MYSRILVPVDGSKTSDRGLKEAIKLAKDQKAKIRLVHVIDESLLVYDSYSMLSGGGVILQEFRERGEKVLAAARSLAARSEVEVESIMIQTLGRRVADMVVKEARDWHADLIVMGTHGRRGFSHLVLGSDAAAVLHDAPVPVLLVRSVPDQAGSSSQSEPAIGAMP
jgi:nucleotide-binding universal stress UspA family protein